MTDGQTKTLPKGGWVKNVMGRRTDGHSKNGNIHPMAGCRNFGKNFCLRERHL